MLLPRTVEFSFEATECCGKELSIMKSIDVLLISPTPFLIDRESVWLPAEGKGLMTPEVVVWGVQVVEEIQYIISSLDDESDAKTEKLPIPARTKA